MTVAFLESQPDIELPYITDRLHDPVIMPVTPELANEWLDRVPDHQRAVRHEAVERYKKNMLRGTWKTDFSPFRFDKQGNLIDGQHRCWAITEAGITLKRQAVVFGMDPEDYEALDQGVKRTFADTLKYYGYNNCNLMSSLAHRIYFWELGQTLKRSKDRPTQDDLLKIVRDYESDMHTSIRIGVKVASNVKPISNSVAAMVHFVVNRIDESDAEEFFARLADGQGLLDGDPIYVLRNRWAVNAEKQRDKPDDVVQGAHIIKAWNYYRDGKSIQLLSWRGGGAKPEPFPQPK